jgi:hypothetical protein
MFKLGVVYKSGRNCSHFPCVPLLPWLDLLANVEQVMASLLEQSPAPPRCSTSQSTAAQDAIRHVWMMPPKCAAVQMALRDPYRCG